MTDFEKAILQQQNEFQEEFQKQFQESQLKQQANLFAGMLARQKSMLAMQEQLIARTEHLFSGHATEYATAHTEPTDVIDVEEATHALKPFVPQQPASTLAAQIEQPQGV